VRHRVAAWIYRLHENVTQYFPSELLGVNLYTAEAQCDYTIHTKLTNYAKKKKRSNNLQ